MDAPVVGRLIGDNADIESTDSRERRRGSGSFMGAEESDEEIAFRGSARDRLGEFSSGEMTPAMMTETFPPQGLMATRGWRTVPDLSQPRRRN